MAKPIKSKRAELINRDKKKWHLTFSIKNARNYAGRNQVYRLPNGIYAVRKRRRKKK